METTTITNDGSGLRFDAQKLRFDLIPNYAQEQYVKVLTLGAQKYGDRNWERGMAWSRVIASLKRHLHALESCEDYDSETGLLHAAHIMTNAAFLTEYYEIYPFGDDRVRHARPLATKRLAIRLECLYNSADDGVIDPTSEYFRMLPSITPQDIAQLAPHYYITSLPLSMQSHVLWWLDHHHFPVAQVIHLDSTNGDDDNWVSELTDLIELLDVNVFVDECENVFYSLCDETATFCYLLDRPHNAHVRAGHKRLHSFRNLV